MPSAFTSPAYLCGVSRPPHDVGLISSTWPPTGTLASSRPRLDSALILWETRGQVRPVDHERVSEQAERGRVPVAVPEVERHDRRISDFGGDDERARSQLRLELGEQVRDIALGSLHGDGPVDEERDAGGCQGRDGDDRPCQAAADAGQSPGEGNHRGDGGDAKVAGVPRVNDLGGYPGDAQRRQRHGSRKGQG